MPTDRAPIAALRGAAVVVLALPLVSGAARAESVYQDQIPNVPEACATCHTDAGGSALNAFGDDVNATRDRAVDAVTVVRWSLVFNVDSDGDGQTNGMELGDPCGVWTPGSEPPRATEISAPADEDVLSRDPVVGCPDGESPPDEVTPRPEKDRVYDLYAETTPNPFDLANGCFGNQSRGDGATTTLGALALLLLARRRRTAR